MLEVGCFFIGEVELAHVAGDGAEEDSVWVVRGVPSAISTAVSGSPILILTQEINLDLVYSIIFELLLREVIKADRL